jgi:hypothetical protein
MEEPTEERTRRGRWLQRAQDVQRCSTSFGSSELHRARKRTRTIATKSAGPPMSVADDACVHRRAARMFRRGVGDTHHTVGKNQKLLSRRWELPAIELRVVA